MIYDLSKHFPDEYRILILIVSGHSEYNMNYFYCFHWSQKWIRFALGRVMSLCECCFFCENYKDKVCLNNSGKQEKKIKIVNKLRNIKKYSESNGVWSWKVFFTWRKRRAGFSMFCMKNEEVCFKTISAIQSKSQHYRNSLCLTLYIEVAYFCCFVVIF